MAIRSGYVLLWAYAAWYAASVFGSLIDVEAVATIGPGMAIVAGVIAARRPLDRQAAT